MPQMIRALNHVTISLISQIKIFSKQENEIQNQTINDKIYASKYRTHVIQRKNNNTSHSSIIQQPSHPIRHQPDQRATCGSALRSQLGFRVIPLKIFSKLRMAYILDKHVTRLATGTKRPQSYSKI